MRKQIAGNHAEERARMMFVKIVDLRLQVIDVMPSLQNHLGAQSSTGPCDR